MNALNILSPNRLGDDPEAAVTTSPTEVKSTKYIETDGGVGGYNVIRTYTGNFTSSSGKISGQVSKIDYVGGYFDGWDVWPTHWTISDIDLPVSAFEGTREQVLRAVFAGDDDIRGSTAYDVLHGFDGDDFIKGNGGGDTIDGGLGADIMVGGGGDTRYYVDNARDATIEFAGGGRDTVFSVVDHTLREYVDDLLLLDNAITGTGNELKNLVDGTDGNNMLYGLGGGDTLQGNRGDDILNGGAGADFLGGSIGVDTASYSNATTGLTASLIKPLVNTGEAAGDTYSEIENLLGSKYGDVLIGDAGSNALNGGDGNDVLHGRQGADALIGGAGTDTASYSSASAGVTASMSNTALNTNDAEGDTFNAIENLTGSSHNDYLYGSTGANTLSGGAGNDKLNGGLGNDRLSGGTGNDTFLFSSALIASTNIDTITDFNVADDTIWLSKAVFKGLPSGILASADFHKGTAAADSSDRIIYNSSTGKLSYDADGSGAKAAVDFAIVAKNLALTNADFMIY